MGSFKGGEDDGDKRHDKDVLEEQTSLVVVGRTTARDRVFVQMGGSGRTIMNEDKSRTMTCCCVEIYHIPNEQPKGNPTNPSPVNCAYISISAEEKKPQTCLSLSTQE